MTNRSPKSRFTRLAAALAATAFLAPTAALAEDTEIPKGKSIEEYLREQLQGGELQGALRDLMKSFEPVAKELDQMMRDLPQYEAPEVLPNGDIIIRRKRGDEIKT